MEIVWVLHKKSVGEAGNIKMPKLAFPCDLTGEYPVIIKPSSTI